MRYLLLAIPFLFGFTYPVDLDEQYMMYNTSTENIGKARLWPRADGMAIDGLDADLTPLMLTVAPKPAYDVGTQFLFPNMIVDIPNEEYRREWIIMTLSAEDLAQIQKTAEIEDEKVQAIAIYQDLIDGIGTNVERIARVERTLAHLLRLRYLP